MPVPLISAIRMSEPCENSSCYIRGCDALVAGSGVRIAHPLCERHLDQDRNRVRDITKAVQKQLEPIMNYRNGLRLQQQALAVEMQESEDLFESLLESLTKWKAAVTRRLTARHNTVMEPLRELSVLQELETAVAEADANNDMKKVFDLTGMIELECDDFNERFNIDDYANSSNDSLRCVGDVSGSLRDLQVIVGRHLNGVLRLCESSLDETCTKQSLCKIQSEIVGLPGSPDLISACSDTAGYFVDSTGKLAKIDSSNDEAGAVQKLPQPCLFVKLDKNCGLNYFLACSIDGTLKAEVHCDIDWSKPIAGFSCDSKRQTLYIAQNNMVKIADLSGRMLKEINNSSVGLRMGIQAMNCSADKIIILHNRKQESVVISVDKDSGQVLNSLSLNRERGFPSDEFYECMSVVNNVMFLTASNAKKLYKFCMTSGQLIAAYPTKQSPFEGFEEPTSVLAHRSGLIFIRDSYRRLVNVLLSDGSVLEILGLNDLQHETANNEEEFDEYYYTEVSNEGELNRPDGLAIVEGDSELLAVCQNAEKSILIYQLKDFSI